MSLGRLPILCKRGVLLFPLLLFVLVVTVVTVCPDEPFVIPEQTLRMAEKQYGPAARQRLLEWQHLIQTSDASSEKEQLDTVNRFFNRLDFIDDIIHWQQEDYWATPVEFLASGGGDCEDFAIAKFFTLLLLGIPEAKLTLTYAKALHLNQAHMVLTYYPSPGAEPLVLDNLVDTIDPSSQRTDLLPVYSINGTGLWLAKQRGRGKLVGDSSRLSRWSDLLTRIDQELSFLKDIP
ncbi:transglutaminase-like cysteine peptidase [Desulfobulbus alkaliphilus]|uniref:transglutaminase-like cysteine peptidase n=1 Tax=Desulfobulbus alkaliphilus TaxID=869814 RepID=UPI001962855E|nr:transglutaminase-like cysteine peptidase [Desulfobulbus alkaliphilus]MBM9538132.1 transglutaminase-like cysteine peptidase [Desulfobulbus alkaliphilus]